MTDSTIDSLVGPSEAQALAHRMLKLQEKEAEVVKLIADYGWIDGSHHKQWLLCKILKTLLGEEEYQQWVKEFEAGEDGPDTYYWDEGIAP